MRLQSVCTCSLSFSSRLVNNRFHLNCVRFFSSRWAENQHQIWMYPYFTLQRQWRRSFDGRQYFSIHTEAENVWGYCVVLPHMPMPMFHCSVVKVLFGFGSSLPFTMTTTTTTISYNFLHVLFVCSWLSNRQETTGASWKGLWCDYDVANAGKWRMILFYAKTI